MVPPSNKELATKNDLKLTPPGSFIQSTDVYQVLTVWQRLGTGLDNEDLAVTKPSLLVNVPGFF